MLASVCNLLFPRRCPVCGDIVEPAEDLIHRACLAKLSPVKQPVCKKCGKEVFGDHMEYCYDCTRHLRSFESGMALLNYNEAARHSVAAVKYRNRREYLDFYASAIDVRFGKRVARLGADALIPVPVHPSRRRKRGFNQAEELAVRLGRLWDIPVESRLLVRNKKTAPQRDLNPAERLKNLQEAFAVRLPARNGERKGEQETAPTLPRSVILVDDIYTTGSTIEACTRVLKKAGVKNVYFVVICIGSQT